MGKCKNIECNNQTEGKKVYCSMKCRNYYVNKYLRDYSKNGEGLSKEAKREYETNPKYCVNPKCGEKLPYEKRRNDYCDSSCQAMITNLGRILSQETKDKIRSSYIKNNGELKTIQCKNCGLELMVKERRKYCDSKCRKEFRRKDMDEYSKYKEDAKFTFGLGDYPDEFNFDLIIEYGWYVPSNSKKPNITGVSRDHMLSVREGFDMGIDPKLLSHPANCKLMIHGDNISKNKKSSITKEELLGRIGDWNNKYGDIA